MLLLFQCLTGDDWSMIMDDALITPERGCSYEDGDCGSPLAVPYFVSFLLIGTCAGKRLEPGSRMSTCFMGLECSPTLLVVFLSLPCPMKMMTPAYPPLGSRLPQSCGRDHARNIVDLEQQTRGQDLGGGHPEVLGGLESI